jgi:hypothetical protein
VRARLHHPAWAISSLVVGIALPLAGIGFIVLGGCGTLRRREPAAAAT